MDNKMISYTFEAWQEIEARRRERLEKDYPQHLAGHDSVVAKMKKQREELQSKFPFVAIVAGGHHQHDIAVRWLYRNVGPQNGPCQEVYSEFPGCDLVLATKQQKDGWSQYSNPGKHEHVGIWQSVYLGKTGYDYGPAEYYFQNENDKDKFLAFALSAETFGEYYTKEFEHDAGI